MEENISIKKFCCEFGLFKLKGLKHKVGSNAHTLSYDKHYELFDLSLFVTIV